MRKGFSYYGVLLLVLSSSSVQSRVASCAFQPSLTAISSGPRRKGPLRPPTSTAPPGDRSISLTIRGGSPNTNENDTSTFALWQELLAELLGTFLIVQMGTASIMATQFMNAPLLPIPLTWAVAVTLAIAVTAPISGAHLNPAISLALACVRPSASGRKKLLPYMAAQFAGAMVASGTNLLLYGPAIRQYEVTHGLVRASAPVTAAAFGEYYTTAVGRALGVEVFGTAVLATVIFALTHPRQRRRASVAPWIGATVGVLIATLAPWTQAGLNPARDGGPRLVAYWAGWTTVAFQPRGFALVYGLGPMVGALLGALLVDRVLYRTTRHPGKDESS
jgi:glycerol uptake facilitator protein